MLHAYTNTNLKRVKELGLEGILLPQYDLYSRLSDIWKVVEDYYLSCILPEVNDEELKEFFKGVLVRVKYLSTSICKGGTESEKDYIERVVYSSHELGKLDSRVKNLKDVVGFGEEEENKGWGYIAVTDVVDEGDKKLEVYDTWRGEFRSIVRGVCPDETWYKNVKSEFLNALNYSLNAFRYLTLSESFKSGRMICEDRAEVIKRLNEIDTLLLDTLIGEVGKGSLKKEVLQQKVIGGNWSLFK